MLELLKVNAGYSNNPVLHSISCRFKPGKVTALLGRNGCGKSTLLRTAVGLITPSSGQVLLNDKPLEDCSATCRAQQIAFLPQSRNMPQITALRLVQHGRYPHMTGYPRRLSSHDENIALHSLRSVGAQDLAQYMLHTLSGGERQKVYLAMALCQQAQTLLLDEPTTYLDACHQFELWELCRRIAQEGRAVVVVTHDVAQALTWADYLLVLKDGHLAAEGSAEQVLQNGLLESIFSISIVRAGQSTYAAAPLFNETTKGVLTHDN
ncbi:MAG: ABC transporter ATP-binding protein [Christensenellaceae bacterium]|nr:ABC transporter ATP-binding protein [Christensenellaceae bacterium]